jgi:hypothetical protein
MELDPRQKQLIAISGGTLFLLLVVWLLLGRGGGNSASAEQSMKMICQNPTCRYEFSITPDDAHAYLEKHPGDSIHCPKCNGTDLLQAGKTDRGSRTELPPPPPNTGKSRGGAPK